MIVGAVVVIERRNGQQSIGIKGVNPRECRVAIRLDFGIMQAVTGKSVWARWWKELGFGIDRESDSSRGRREPHDAVVDSWGSGLKMNEVNPPKPLAASLTGLRNGRLQAVLAAVAVEAGVISGTGGVASTTDLVVGLVEIAGGNDEIAFSGRARNRCGARC